MLLSVWRIMLGLWLASVLLVISLPWASFDATLHWNNVQWIPFTHFNMHPSVLAETALNIVAFIPVGYLSARSSLLKRWSPFAVASLLGFMSSFTAEFYQLFCQDRVPSTTDVLMNVMGTAIGVWLAFAIDHMLSFFVVTARRLTA